MTGNKYKLLFAVMVFGLFGANTQAEETKEQKEPIPRPGLTFEVSSSQLRVAFLPPEVTHVGLFHVKVDRDLLPWLYYELSESPYWRKMSEAQRQLLSKMFDGRGWLPREQQLTEPFSQQSDLVATPTGMNTYRVVGVSAEDIEVTVQAIVERWDDITRVALRRWRDNREDSRRRVEEWTKRLPEARAEYDAAVSTAQEKTKEFMRTVYGVAYSEDTREVVKRLIQEYSYSLKLLEFELIGIDAKNKAIDRLSNSPKVTDTGAMAKLQELMVLNQVDLAGALARKAAIEASLKEALEVHELGIRVAALKREISELDRSLERGKQGLETGGRPSRWATPITIHENKVVIHPARRGEGG